MKIRFPWIGLSLLLAVTQAGCVALNVPSQRYHDPDDCGGVFGAWSRTTASPSLHDDPHQPPTHCVEDDCFTGGSLECDPFDTSVGPEGKPKPPEVPWPRFHPIPTRPVFGTSPL